MIFRGFLRSVELIVQDSMLWFNFLRRYLRLTDDWPGCGLVQSVAGPNPKNLQGNEMLFIWYILASVNPVYQASSSHVIFFFESFCMKSINVKMFL